MTNKIYTSPVAAYVEFDTYRALETYLLDVRHPSNIHVVITLAVREWLANARRRAADAPSTNVRGYLWKNLFLPDGTRLRTEVAGTVWYATVQGDRLICDNEPTSPHRFANRFGQAGRNAWKTISLLFPYETQWRPAASCRAQQPNGLYG
ncbi:hypothetical protein E4L96_01260 [Massilia arenosa]|uniref:DUF2924 domain-containing protein n=1 Tax=Zemynaea arenosa TaxID=2561931 RepID=A0A4Y9SSI8_9BURK|nr:hypothetical protein [Massilia arenosa]TFW29670.1 hypothetical protein E4L96_01260 [Massilia arenosa]